MNLCTKIGAVLVALMVSLNVVAKNQQIIEIETTDTYEGLKIELHYDSTGQQPSTGLGIRLHFNSEQLVFDDYSEVYSANILAKSTQPQRDSNDYDNNPLTDSYLHFAWADMMGDWPEFTDEGLTIVSVLFTAKDQGFPELGISASSVANGFELIVR